MARCVIWAMLVLLLPSGNIGCNNKTPQSDVEPQIAAKETRQGQLQKVIGRWLRTDGGYIIEVTNLSADGNLDAAYYNPNPIHVAESAVKEDDGQVKVFIKLQDEGYPGSTYDLLYDTGNDILTGIYFQATMKQEYQVVFERMK